MTKLLTCPICGKENVPVRNDAEVCSTKCRMKKMRLKKKHKGMQEWREFIDNFEERDDERRCK